MEIEREYYAHDAGCSGKNFEETNDRGLRRCKECSGVFDSEGKGVAVTDRRFDEGYETRPPEAWGPKV